MEIKNTCPSPCNTTYFFKEEDKEWGRSNTFCPKCRSSLGVQWFQKDFNDKKSRREISLSKNEDGTVSYFYADGSHAYTVDKSGSWQL